MRAGSPHHLPRTQSSIAISANSTDWLLVNASPDVLQQIKAFPGLQPARALRDTGIAAVMLMTSGNPLFKVLEHYCGIDWQALSLEDNFAINGLDGLAFAVLPLLSNAPPYSPHRDKPQPGDNVGLSVTDTATGKKLFYAPGLGQMEPHVWAAMQASDCVLVDGTLWTDDEMIALGASKKTSRSMGHLPQSGADGMIEWLDKLPNHVRKILIHINNTNPILDAQSPQRQTLTEHGIEVAFDGMEITL